MMTMPNRLLVGTALCLLMAVPAGARAGVGDRAERSPSANELPLILAQAEDPGAEGDEPEAEGCPPGSASQDGGCVLLEETAPAEEAPPAEMPPEAEAPAPEAVAPEPEAMPDPVPAEETAPEQPTEPAIEPEAQAPAPAEEAPAEAVPAEPESEPAIEEQVEPQMEEESPPEEPAIEEQTEEEARPGAEEAQPEGEAQQPESEEGPAEDAGQEQPAQTEEEPATPEAESQVPADEAPTGEQAQPETDTGEAPTEQAEPADEAAPDAGQQAEPDAGEAPLQDADTQSRDEETEQAEEPDREVMPEEAAPVLDSQKEGGAEALDEIAPEATEGQPAEGEQLEEQAEETVVPERDQQAQENVIDPEQVREEIRALVQEEGQRIELGQTPEDQLVRRREIFRPRENAQVIEQYNDNRTIVEINNRTFVENPDYDRIVDRGDRVYYEELRGDRVREVVEREDGTRIITVRNRYGDILRRVRVTPDGGEYVLAYVPDDRIDFVSRFEDPAADLPPLRLTIPESEYILEAETVHDAERYYTFLHQPPVEPVGRIYSLEEVQYSARVRDMMRRVDLDTIEFEFGAARIEESEVRKLEALATAMQRLLDENPAETFLIEGHTDAVGSETANLALSDRRAEAVARGLANVFSIPPENLVTQGYGEQYLKVGTQEPIRKNRRVAVRRITPLVSPTAARQ